MTTMLRRRVEHNTGKPSPKVNVNFHGKYHNIELNYNSRIVALSSLYAAYVGVHNKKCKVV